jgi:uncharacterized protein YecT (DUF1311 family)
MPHSLKAISVFLMLLAASPVVGLDCSKAVTAQDKALCADPKAGAADAAMVKAYQALFDRLSEPDKKALQLSQRLWLRDRTNGCADFSGDKLAACLIDQSQARQRFLEARPEAGPGSGGTLAPLFIEQAGRKGYYEIDVTALKYAPPTTPAEKLFNAEIDKLLKDVPPPPAQNDEFGRDMIYSYTLHVRIAYASPQLISAHSELYLFAGGAHGTGGTSNINIDVARDKLLSFADVFLLAAAKEKLDGECLRQILKEKAKRMPDQKIVGDDLKQLKAGIADGLGKLDSWSFSPQGATVTYDAYALGAYVEGAYTCQFPSDFLRPLVTLGFELP